jgi:hypothetical protein
VTSTAQLRLPHCWGATADEAAERYRCDELMPDARARLLRAVGTTAAPETVYRWLCQLRAAPYSYDWLDNFGRRSPRQLLDWTEPLEPGVPVMTIFTLESFTPGRELTLRIRPGRPTRVFGDVAVTYLARPAGEGSRLLAVLRFADPRGPFGGLRTRALGWGDLLMMRKQLHTLAALAEATEPPAGRPGPPAR